MVLTSTIGFPRIGEKRELKKAVESFWKNPDSIDSLAQSAVSIKKRNYAIQRENGIDLIPSNDFSLYDHVLDHSVMLGQIPQRYLKICAPDSLDVYFAMARGALGLTALEMTKWFDTNYHYIVPELTGEFKLTENRPLKEFRFAKSEFGLITKPVILGFYTYLKLAKIAGTSNFKDKLDGILPAYKQIIKEIVTEGAQFIQIDEPSLVEGQDKEIVEYAGKCYRELAAFKGDSKWILQTYYGDICEHYREVISWPFDYLGIDLVRGPENMEAVKKYGVEPGKNLALGVIDGRNVWKSDIRHIIKLIDSLKERVNIDNAIVQPSSSLMHVPCSTAFETSIPQEIKSLLCFSYEKLAELSQIKGILNGSGSSDACEFSLAQEIEKFKIPETHKRVKDIDEKYFTRDKPFSERNILQQRRFGLPILPTTTIGSFPQTETLRKTRAQWKSRKISDKEYESFIKKETEKIVRLQEETGLDILVHGEFERTDMVEFFGEKLKGFLFTKNGWVQSYGTRCVRPPIIYGDIAREKPMTVELSAYAQSLTKKPLKGMLTGPVTILNWSFPRTDIPKPRIAFQIALALRDEAKDLESAGIRIIQIDEPALREGLPPKRSKRKEYLDWAVKAFRLCSSGVKNDTQIHTHMCYCEFNEIIKEIYALDADVISIENSRSSDELLSVFKEFNYDHHIGPGVYDVHSERIPGVEELEDRIRKILNHVRKELLFINPDCGLKTRDYPETLQSLKNMVAAARNLRAQG